jgi:phage terminase large subunit
MEATNVLLRNMAAYNENESGLFINQGGTSSTKTYSILQLLYLIAKRSKRRLIISVCSYALPHLRLGAVRDFEKILSDEGCNIGEIRNKTENIYEIGNSIIEFFGTDNLAKVHGPRRDILFINEANHIKYDIYIQLAIRTRAAIFIDYNPTMEFWVHDEIIPKEKHVFIKSTYRDNPFLDLATIQRIEARRNNENWWRVYGEGEVGQLEGTILSNWRYLKKDEKWGEGLSFGFGLDFGFNDPDALVKVAIDNRTKKMYWDEKIYKDGNSFEQLRLLVASHCTRNDSIIADCADARMINELKKYFNIKPIIKSDGTVSEVLKLMQDYEHILTPTSFNLAKEFNNYIWNDKKAGIPMDAFNHLIDAGRYRFMNALKGTSYQKWRG